MLLWARLNGRVRLLREELYHLQEPGSYVGEIIKAMGNLNGEAPLNKIYLEVNKYRETPSHSIRGRIYEHASECDAYKKTLSTHSCGSEQVPIVPSSSLPS